MHFEVPTPLAYFASLVESDEHFPLLEAAAAVAQDEYPELDVQRVLGEVDQLLARLKRRLAADAPALQRSACAQPVFFPGPQFRWQPQRLLRPRQQLPAMPCCAPAAAFLSRLAVIWLELAAGLGLHAHGRGLSGALHAQGHLAQGPGDHRSFHRPVAQPRGAVSASGALPPAQRSGR
jgi:hypothetical protein